jgi:hypothetical protein
VLFRYLMAAEVPAVLPHKGYTLRNGLVDQLSATFCQPVNVGAKKAMKSMISKGRHTQDIDQHIPDVLIDTNDERIQLFLSIFV